MRHNRALVTFDPRERSYSVPGLGNLGQILALIDELEDRSLVGTDSDYAPWARLGHV